MSELENKLNYAIQKMRAELTLSDEVGQYLVGPFKKALLKDVRAQTTRWLIAVGVGGLIVGGFIGYWIG
jgi:hypothetical protein